jgi:hypothetical protein
MHTKFVQPRGFVALMSAIVISAILLMLVGSGSLASYYTRFTIVDTELKATSARLAESCAAHARLALAGDATYAGNETVVVGESECTVGVVTSANGIATFEAHGVYQHYETTLLVQVDTVSMQVKNWQEIKNF